MKKILGVTLVLLLCLGMGGCTKQEAVEPTPTETGTVATTTQEKPEPTKNENLREYNKVLVDNDNLRAELLSIEYIYDDFWDQETIKVTFDVKNKQSFPIVVQARSVSINDRMVDTGDGVLVAMSIACSMMLPSFSVNLCMTSLDYTTREAPFAAIFQLLPSI